MKELSAMKKMLALFMVVVLCLSMSAPIKAEGIIPDVQEGEMNVSPIEGNSLGLKEPASKSQIQISPEDDKGREYAIQLKNYNMPSDGKSLSFGIWNEEQGVVRWYEGTYDEDTNAFKGKFDVLDYNVTGNYYIHCYVMKTNGSMEFVSGTTYKVTSLPEYNPAITKAEFTDNTERIFCIELSDFNLKKGQDLMVAVWSDENGQDDMKWNQMQRTDVDKYQLKIPITEYKSPGRYFAHIYCRDEAGDMQYILGTGFEVQKITPGTIEIASLSYDEGKAEVKISNLTSPSGIQNIKVAVWSQNNQSNMYWYNAEKSGNSWKTKIDLNNHKGDWGIYSVHAYAIDGNGFQQYIGGTKLDFSVILGEARAVVDKKTNNVAIQLSQFETPGEIAVVRCAVWSEEGGQDDLSWQELEFDSKSGKWGKQVPLNLFKNSGKCYAHVYLEKRDGTVIYLTGTSFDISKPSVKEVTVVSKNDTGDFQITVKGLNSDLGVSKVEIPVWSQPQMQDIVWYTAAKNANGDYVVSSNISKHKYTVGNYNIHIYVTDNNGIKTVVSCTNMKYESSSTFEIQNDTKETTYKATLKDVVYPAGLEKVEFAVWSEIGGQDDFRWYTALKSGNSYSVNIDIRNHKTLGKYIVHVYGTDKMGAKVYLAGSSQLEVKGNPSGNVQITGRNDGAGTFDVLVSNLKAASGISSIKVAAWSASDGSDMVWYNGNRQSDGTYKVTIDASKHQYHLGNYNVHVYAVMGNQIQSFACGTTYNFKPANYMYILKDQGNGKRTVVLCNPTAISNLRFGVWSEENGQDDIVWYTASKLSDGKWTTTIVAANHKDAGTFQVHAYAGASALTTGSCYIPASEFAKNGWFYENGFKLYYVNDVLQTDVSNIIGSQPSYIAKINRVTCTVTIYAKDGANGYILPVKVLACSVGLPGTETPLGTYNTLQKYRWHELMGPSYGQYCTRIVGGILFHSVAGSNMTSYNLSAYEYNKLGSPASHGCVRLCVRDAKWIYDNCKLGMTVVIYDSTYPGPLGKPSTIKIPASQNWDPTDPNI